jgi:hypothetical protein
VIDIEAMVFESVYKQLGLFKPENVHLVLRLFAALWCVGFLSPHMDIKYQFNRQARAGASVVLVVATLASWYLPVPALTFIGLLSAIFGISSVICPLIEDSKPQPHSRQPQRSSPDSEDYLRRRFQ